MKKKEYIIPETLVVTLPAPQLLIATSSGMNPNVTPIIDPTDVEDNSDPSEPNRARFDEWDDEEEGF